MLCHLYVVQQIIIVLKVILLQLRLAAALCPALQLTLQGFCCTLLAVSQADPIAACSSQVLTGIPVCRTPSFTPISAGRNHDPFRHLYVTPHFFSIQNSTALGWDCLLKKCSITNYITSAHNSKMYVLSIYLCTFDNCSVMNILLCIL